MVYSGNYRPAMERYLTGFESALMQHGLLGEAAPVDGHPVLNICLGFDPLDLTNKPPMEHLSFKETRVDRIVREVFQGSELYRNIRGDSAMDNEAIVDGFPISFWFGFENPMLAVLFSMKRSRKRKRFNFTKRNKALRNGEARRRRTVEGRILTSSMILLRNSVSFSSSLSSFSGNSSDSDWGLENGTGEGRAVLQQYYPQAAQESDSDSDVLFDVNAVSSTESVNMARPGERVDHMDDGSPGPVLHRHRG